MFTTRLSSVITGCGSNEITCSRRSSSGRTRSMNGITIVSPGVRVRAQRPSRSTTPARACGITRTVLASATMMKSATRASTIRAATAGLLFDDEGGRALDLDHVHAGSFLEDLVLEVRARRPFFAADPDTSAVDVDAAENDGLAPDERVRAGSRDGGQAHVPARNRSQERERGDGAD